MPLVAAVLRGTGALANPERYAASYPKGAVQRASLWVQAMVYPAHLVPLTKCNTLRTAKTDVRFRG